MSGSVKSSLTRRILNACGGSRGSSRRRRALSLSLPEALEDRQLLAATSSVQICPPANGALAPTTTTSQTTTSNVAFAPLSETFNLSSRPSATKTIYLDFTGHVTTGTGWNTTFTNGAPIVSPAYTLDLDPNFSNAELTQIQRIWQRVVEDFAPFDVNVTTKEPPISDLVDSGGSDSRYGMRCVIGGAYQDWLGLGAGGIAFISSFGSSQDLPCFVFSRTQLLNEQYIADTISHEVGHTLGLNHDGTPGQSYYPGHGGTGPTSWGPIMGSTFDRQVSQWSKGEYTNANNREDDLSIITTQNGFGYRADDFGNTRFTASQLPSKKVGGTRTVNTSGVIERNTDQDWFSFTTTGGVVNLSFTGDSISSNLDISVSLFDPSGVLVATVNPASSLTATLSMNLAAGTYSVMVDGVGFGTLANGYSDYGSIGQYFITGTIPDTSSGTSSGGTSVIEGRVVSDANNNGLIDGTDGGISGVMVFIDLDGNGAFNASVDRSGRTDSTGRFRFTGLLGGTYNLYQVTPSGWQQTRPASGALPVFVAAASTESNVFFRNVRPPVLGSIGTTVTSVSGGSPVLLTATGTVTDADTSVFGGAVLTVGITANAGSADVLSVRNQGNGPGQVGAFAGFIRFGGVNVATVSGGIAGSNLVITFNTNATLAIVQAVLRNLTFSTTSAAGPRSVSFSLTDGKGGVSATVTKQVSVV